MMDQKIISLYDEYVHVHFDRRLFLDRLAKHVGGMGAALAIAPTLVSNYALAETIAESDTRITTENVTYKGATGDVKAYLARPRAGAARRGSIVVVHQNRGLNAHIKDLARRFATEGYNGLAVDFLSPLGGTPADENAAGQMFGQLKADETNANAVAAVAYLRSRPDSNGKVGAVGFCWGGGVIAAMAVLDPTLNAGVVYYGSPPKAEDVAKIKAPLLLHYGDAKLDTRIGGTVPAFEAALKAGGKTVEGPYFYEGANHAFNDDTSTRYDKAAADLAWSRTLAMFRKYVA